MKLLHIEPNSKQDINNKIIDKEENINSFIDFYEIKFENTEKEDKILVYPKSGKIISEKEFNNLCKVKLKDNSIVKPKKRLSNEIKNLLNTNNSNNSIKDQNNKILLINKINSNWSESKINNEIEKIKKEIDKKEKENNKVKEEDLDRYTELVNKWKKISQKAIYELLECFPEDEHYNKNSIGNVVKSFNIDKDLIGYDEENEDFYD